MIARYSLRAAEKVSGIDRRTLRKWLAECGYCLPDVKRGSKILLTDADLAVVLGKHSPQRSAA